MDILENIYINGESCGLISLPLSTLPRIRLFLYNKTLSSYKIHNSNQKLIQYS